MVDPDAASTTTGPVERAFRVLQHVAAAEAPVGVRELGRRAGLPRSTASRLASQLIDLGMLARNPSGELVVGPAVATLQGRDAVPPALEDQLRPLLLDLVERFGESAALTVDTPAGAHYLAQIPGPSAVQVPDSTGASLPFHQVAPGFVLMASWPRERLASYLATELAPATPHTLVEPAAITALVTDAAACGWAWAEQALDLEVNGLAVPVHHERIIVAAVSLYGPAYRLSPTAAPDLGAQLADAVRVGAAIALG
ncbi:MAG: IclR family transcriptional regulator [Acidimicrobiales bacterium]